MCIRFSISTKVKAFPFFMALILVVASSLTEFFKGLIYPILSFFIGVLLTLTFGFVTPRIDRKMHSLNENYFLPLLNIFYRCEPEKFIIDTEKVTGIKEGLAKYGKYFGITCYPGKLIKDCDEFLERAEEHNKLLDKLLEISRNKVGKDNLVILLGLFNLADVNLKNYDPNTVEVYEPVGTYMKQEKTELLERIKTSNKGIRDLRDTIVERLESFLKDNSLEIGEKPVTTELISEA